MKTITYEETLFDISDAIINDEFTGFKEDYLILHSLIRKYKPKTFFEIGTNMGTGTNIICNAMILSKENTRKLGRDCDIYSLDLPTELAHVSLQHPISEGKGDNVGSRCTFPYTQLRGDSMTFDFSKYPCEGYYCDGEHSTKNVCHETEQILMKCYPVIMIFHDSDLPEVEAGILKAFERNKLLRDNYDLFRVTGTRIAYAIRK